MRLLFCKKSFVLLLLFSVCKNEIFAQHNNSKTHKELKNTSTKLLVVDDKGQPIQGVTITIKGGKSIGLTDDQGQFEARALSANSTLVFSSVGYSDKELLITDQSSYKIVLEPTSDILNDVVVIGYGTQRQRNVTGAITSFNTKSIEEKPIARIDQAMIGQMPGVKIVQQTGMVGSGFSVQVRGSGSLAAGKEPLYVIDGFPLDVSTPSSSGGFATNPLNNLNPADIEDIQVLKDAAAGAIYGSRAANGVVLITTKRGKTGKAIININAYTGVSQVAKKMDVLSPEEWIKQATELENYKWVNSGTGRTADQTNDQRRAILGLKPGAYNTSFMPDDRWSMPGHPGIQYVNWQDQAFRSAGFHNGEISASGGTDAVHYFISGDYLNQGGTLLNSNYTNYSARANVEVNASKRIKLGINLAPSYSETNNPAAEGKDNILMKLYNMSPIVEDTAGLNTGAGKNAVYPWATSSISPVATLLNTINLNKQSRNLYTMYGSYSILDGLTLKTTLNYDDLTQNVTKYTSDFVSGNITDRLNNPGKGSSGSYSGYKKQNFVNENTINYDKTFANNHHLAIVVGQSYNWVHIENYTLNTAGGYANDVIQTLNNAIPNANGVTVTGNTTASNSTLLSYYGRVQYDYKSKYLISASIRKDASSRFGSANQWGTFPSLSLGWRMSDEDFMKNIHFISDLKLRASYGKAGNNNIGDYAPQELLSTSGYSFGSTAVTGQILGVIPNPHLKWETSNTYDAGMDVSFFNNRLNLTIDYYKRKSTDLLLNIPVPAATGFLTSLQNIGSVENSGLEIGLNANAVTVGNFNWNINANIAFNKNKVAQLGPDGANINVASTYGGNPPFLLNIGLPMYSYYLIKTEGILTQADIDNPDVAKISGETVGDAKYFDKDGNHQIDANDRIIAGQPNPKYSWGFTNNFTYKNLDLSIQMYGQHGGKIMSFLARAIDNPANGAATTLGVWRNRWTAENQNYNAPRGKIGEKYTIPYFTTDWLYSSDFWRIQSVTLGYNLKGLFKEGVLHNIRVYASMQNWFGHDKYAGGVNPEAQNTNTSGNGSFPLPGDYGAMPLSKSITLGVNLSF